MSIELYVIIRTRGGNFVYSDAELQQMIAFISTIKKLKGVGFVFGILKVDGSVDKTKNKALVASAHPWPCNFHRAFDGIQNKFQSLEILINCGFKIILTSGEGTYVMEGIDMLAMLLKKVQDKIMIMPGGGLGSTNIALVKQKTKAILYHSSAITDSSSLANSA